MRDDIDPKSISQLHLECRTAMTLPSGKTIKPGNHGGYRAAGKNGSVHTFLALHPSDDSNDWVDISDHIDNFTINETAPAVKG